MSAGNLFNALIALTGMVVVGTLFSAAMIWFALRISGGGKVRADAKINQAGRRIVGRQLSVTNAYKTIQTNQTNSTSKSRIMSGREG